MPGNSRFAGKNRLNRKGERHDGCAPGVLAVGRHPEGFLHAHVEAMAFMEVAIAVGPGRYRDADDFLGPALRSGGKEVLGVPGLKMRCRLMDLKPFSFRRSRTQK